MTGYKHIHVATAHNGKYCVVCTLHHDMYMYNIYSTKSYFWLCHVVPTDCTTRSRSNSVTDDTLTGRHTDHTIDVHTSYAESMW